MGDSLPAINVDLLTSSVNNAVNGGRLLPTPLLPLPPLSYFLPLPNSSSAMLQSQPRLSSVHSTPSLVQPLSSVTAGNSRVAVDSRFAVPVYVPTPCGATSQTAGIPSAVPFPVSPLPVPFLGSRPSGMGGPVPVGSLPRFQSLFTSSHPGRTFQFPSQSFGFSTGTTVGLPCSSVGTTPVSIASVTLLTTAKPASKLAESSSSTSDTGSPQSGIGRESSVSSLSSVNVFTSESDTQAAASSLNKPSAVFQQNATRTVSSASTISPSQPCDACSTPSSVTAGELRSDASSAGALYERGGDGDEAIKTVSNHSDDRFCSDPCHSVVAAASAVDGPGSANGSCQSVGMTATTITSSSTKMSTTILSTTTAGMAYMMSTPKANTGGSSLLSYGNYPIIPNDCQQEDASHAGSTHGCTSNGVYRSVETGGCVSGPSFGPSVVASSIAESALGTAVSMPGCPAPPMFIMFSLRLPVMPDAVSSAVSSQSQNKRQDGCNSSAEQGGPLPSPRLSPFPPFPLLFPFFPPSAPDDCQSRGGLPFVDVRPSTGPAANLASLVGNLSSSLNSSSASLPLPPVTFPQTLPLQLPTSLPFLPMPPPLPPPSLPSQSLLTSGPHGDFVPLPPLILQPTGSVTSLPLPPFLQPHPACLAPFPFAPAMSGTSPDVQTGQPLLPFHQQSFAPFVQSGLPLTLSSGSLSLPLLLPPLSVPVSTSDGAPHSCGCSARTTLPSKSLQRGLSVVAESLSFPCPHSRGPFSTTAFSLQGLPPLPLLPTPSTSSFSLMPPHPVTPASCADSSVDTTCPLTLSLSCPVPQFSLSSMSVAGQPLLPPFGGQLLPPPPLMPHCQPPPSLPFSDKSALDAFQVSKARVYVDGGDASDKSSDSEDDGMAIDETVTDEPSFDEMIIDEETDSLTVDAATGPTVCCFAGERAVLNICAQETLTKCKFAQDGSHHGQLLSFSSSDVDEGKRRSNVFEEPLPSKQSVEMIPDHIKVKDVLLEIPSDVGPSSIPVSTSEQFDGDNGGISSTLYSPQLPVSSGKNLDSFREEPRRLHHYPLVSPSSNSLPLTCHFSRSNHLSAGECVPACSDYQTYGGSVVQSSALGVGGFQLSHLATLPTIPPSANKGSHANIHSFQPQCIVVKERHPPLSSNVSSFYPVTMDADASYLLMLPNPDNEFSYPESLPACVAEAQPAVSPRSVQPILNVQLSDKPGAVSELYKKRPSASELFPVPVCVSCPPQGSFHSCVPTSFSELHPDAVLSSLTDHEGVHSSGKDLPVTVSLSEACHYDHQGSFSSLVNEVTAQKAWNKGGGLLASAVSLSESCHFQGSSFGCLAAADDSIVRGVNKDSTGTATTLGDPCHFHGNLSSLSAADFNFSVTPAPAVSVDHRANRTILPAVGYSPPGLSNHGLSPTLFSPAAMMEQRPEAPRNMACLHGDAPTASASGQVLGLSAVSASVLDMLLMKADRATLDKGSVEMLGETAVLPGSAAMNGGMTMTGPALSTDVYAPPPVSVRVQGRTALFPTPDGEADDTSSSSSQQSFGVREDVGQLSEPFFTGQFCVECNMVCSEPCKHGVMKSQHVADSPLLTRARATVPRSLTLKPSGVAGHFNNTGVFCNTAILAKTEFGPLQGNLVAGDSSVPCSFGTWKIFFKGCVRILDVSDEHASNWMMFIKPARDAVERNLIAFQNGADVMFVTTRDVQPDTELLFWFAHDYCEMISGKSKPPQYCPYCPVCSTVFFDRAQQRRHTKLSHHGGAAAAAKKWLCSACPAQFRLHNKLTEHVMTCHMHLKPWACTLCGKEFTERRNFNTHMAMHEGVRKFGCETCGKRFLQKAHLQSHHATHTKVKAAQCRYCSKHFVRTSDMRQHELQHTRVQALACPQCHKTFHRTELLRRHVKNVHENQRNYLCERCSKSFHTKSKLVRHAKYCFDHSQSNSSPPPPSSLLSPSRAVVASSKSLTLSKRKPESSQSMFSQSGVAAPLTSQSSALLAALSSVPVVINSTS